MQAKLQWDGPWTIDGRIIQLSDWRESFQPAFENLSTVAVWIQLHHVPMELWNRDLLKLIASQFGRVLKIDEHTLNLSRSKYARICVEIDLDLPLQKGTWVIYGDNSVFIIALYEKLPVFCYRCGRVGHGESNCTLLSSRKSDDGPWSPAVSLEKAMEVDDPHQSPGEATEGMVDSLMNDKEEFNIIPGVEDNSPEFGSWMKPRSHKGLGRGRGRGGAHNPNPACQNKNDEQLPDTCLEQAPLFTTCGGFSRRSAATVYLSSKVVFLHLENAKAIELIPNVENGSLYRLEDFPSDFSLGPNTLSATINLAEAVMPCSPLILVPIPAQSDGLETAAPSHPSHPACPSHSSFQTFSSQPLLLTSATQNDDDSHHSFLVDKVKLSFLPLPPKDF